MTPYKSATESQKTEKSTGADTPFAHIIALEQQEQERVQKEISAMQEEEQNARQACAKREAAMEEELRIKAKDELKEYREKELAPILKMAEADAARRTKELETHFAKQSEELAQELIDLLASDDSPFTF